MIDTKRPIRRSRDERMLGGVLGGLADWLDWDPSVARVAWILLTVFTGFALGAIAYAILWVFVPLEESLVHHVPELDDVAGVLAGLARPGDLVLTLGAGTITSVGPQVLAALASLAEPVVPTPVETPEPPDA